MARWEEALDAKLDLYTFTMSERGSRYISGWAKAERATGHLQTDATDDMVERVATVAFVADPIWVDPDLQTVWEAAVPSFEPEPLVEQDLITQAGFCYLPRPHATVDIHGRRTTFRAFAWARTMLDWRVKSDPTFDANFAGTLVFVFHQIGDADDYDDGHGNMTWYDDGVLKSRPYADGNLRRGDLILDFVYPWPFGARIDPDGVRRLPMKSVMPGVYKYDEDGETVIGGDAETFGRKVKTDGPDNIEKHVQCLWRLMQQTIATRTEVEPTRPVRRRYEHAKVDARRITVIQLRKPSGPATGNQRDVEWSHRWLVSGHWRKQYYPTLKLHRQIWISPYIKGPDDAPLEVRKERVFELVR